MNVAGVVDNAAGSSINLSGSGNSLTAQGLTNDGSISVDAGSTADFRNSGAGQLTNLTAGTLTGGTYTISGSLFYDIGSDSSTYIQVLNNANISLTGAGALLFGAKAGTDALAGTGAQALSALTNNSSLTLSGQTRTFDPTGGTFTLASSALNLNNASAVTIQGGLNQGTGSTVSLTGGSTLTVQGALSNLTGGTLTGGTYNLDGNFSYNAGSDGSTYIQTLNGVNMTLNSGGALLFGSSPGTNALTQLSTLMNSTLTFNGQSLSINPNNNNSAFTLDPSTLNVTGGTTLNIAGLVDNTAGSNINLNGSGNLLTGQGLTNNGAISVDGGSTADFRNSGTGQLTNLTGGTLTGGTYTLGGNLFYDTGSDGASTNIQTLSGVNMTLNGAGAILYGAGGGTNALAQLATLTNSTMALGNGQNLSINPNGTNSVFTLNSSTLNMSGGSTANFTGRINNASGNINLNGGGNSLTAQAFTNTGNINVGLNDTATFVIGGAAGTAINRAGGQINITDGGTLTLQNYNAGGSGTLTNKSNINITGNTIGGTLLLDDGGNGSAFTLSGNGTLTLAGLSQITGNYGDETLINDVNHTITGSGTISNLQLTNNGNITATAGGNLVLDVSATSSMTNNGRLNVNDGATLTIQDTSFSGNTNITNNGSINLNGAKAPTTLAFNDGGNQQTFVLTGAGVLNMTDNANNLIAGVTGDEYLVNDVNHTIQGSGTFSNLENFENDGTMKVTGAVGVTFNLNNISPVDNQPDTFTNAGLVNVSNGSTLTFVSNTGSYVENDGTINLGNATDGSAGHLVFNDNGNGGAFVLTTQAPGPALVQMTNNAANSISGFNGTEGLLNDFGHTIAGTGTISNFASFFNLGTLNSNVGGTLFVSSPLFNWDGAGTLTEGTYIAQNGSTLQLSSLGSSQIQTLSGASITLNGTGLITGDGTTNAAAGISTVYSGGLFGQAALTLNSLTGPINLATSGGVFTVSSDDNNANNGGNASLNLSNSTATIAGDLTNTATTSNGGTATSTVALSNGASLTVNNLNNSATAGTNTGFDTASAQVNLTGASSLAVNGNLSNSSLVTNNSFGSASASISLDGASSLTVSGTFTNTAASLSVTNNSTATVSGLFTNDSNSTVTLGASGGGGGGPVQGLVGTGGTLTTNGGFSNAGLVTLYNASTLADTGLFDNTGGTLTLNGGGNTVTATSFTNTNGTINVGAGDIADFRNAGTGQLTNLSGGTLYGGTYNIAGSLFYDVGGDGSSTNILGLNGASVSLTGSGAILFGANAGTNALSTLNSIYGGPTGYASLSLNSLTNPLTLSPSGGVLAVLGDDNNTTNGTGQTSLNLSASTVIVSGDLTNTASSIDGTGAASTVFLSNSSNLTVNNLANTAVNTSGNFGTASAEVSLTGGSALTVNGNLTNASTNNPIYAGTTASISLGDASSLTVTGNVSNTANNYGGGTSTASALITLDGGSNLTVGGTFSNTNALLQLTNNSTATVTGLFTNDIGSTVSLDTPPGGDGGGGGAQAPTVPGSTLTTNGGFSNAGLVTLNNNSTLNNTGVFSNPGTVNLSNTSTLTNTGLFDNTGGTLTLNGGGNKVTATSFTNTNGTISVGAGDTADFRNAGAGQLTNLTGGTLYGGTYNIASGGSLFYDTGGDGTSTNIQALNGANISLTGSGAILFGSGAGTNALSVLNSIYSGTTGAASLSLTGITGATLTIAPGGGTLAISADDSVGYGSGSLNLSATSAAITGNLTNTANAVNGGNANSYVNLSNGSSLTVNNLTNQGAAASNDFSSAAAQVNLTGASNLTVNGNVNNISTDGSFAGGTSASISLDGASSLSVGGTFTNTTSNTGGDSSSAASLNLSNNSTATVAGLFFNGVNSTVNLNGGGNTLFGTGGLTNNGAITVGAGDTADFRTVAGLDTFTNLVNGALNGGTLNVSGNFYYDASAGTGLGQIRNMTGGANITLTGSGQILYGTGAGSDALAALSGITNSTLTLQNLSAPKTITPSGGTLTLAAGTLNINSSSLTVDGAVVVNPNGPFNNSSINLTAGNMTVNGSITNNVGSLGNNVINLNSLNGVASTLTATGALINDSIVSLNGGGNQLFATGFTNNGTIVVGAGDTADFRNGGAGQLTNLSGNTLTGGTYNLSGNLFYDTGGDGTSTNIQALNNVTMTLNGVGAILYGSGSGTNALSQLGTLTNSSNLALNGASLATTVGMNNTNGSTIALSSASTLIIGEALSNDTTSTVILNGGGNQLFALGLTNNGTLTVGAGDTADFRNGGAGRFTNLSGGTLTGGTYNLSGNVFYDTGGDGTSTNINTLSGVNMTLGGAGALLFGSGGGTNALTQLSALTNSSLTLNGQTLSINPNLNNSTFTLDPSTLNLNGTSLTIAGAVNNTGGSSITLNYSGVGSNLSIGGALSNDATSTVTLTGGGNTLTALGLTNNGTLAVAAGDTANFQGGGAGSFTNLSGGTLTGGTYNIGGTFQFDAANGVINNIAAGTNFTLDAQNGGLYQVLSGTNSALANLAGNAGNLTLTNGATLNTDTTANGGPGKFTNTGRVTTTGTGSNALNVTGSIFNTSPGVVNLNGTGDKMTATGQFVNTGLVSLNGNNASVSSLGLDNQSGGTFTLASTGNSVTSTGTASNEGTIAFTGTNGTVSSTGDFTNAASGMVTMTGTGDSLSSLGNVNNAGTVTIGGGEGVTAGLDYIQTDGTTAIDANGTLTAAVVDLQGGTLTGGGTVAGNLLNEGGTVNPGDPQTLTITGDYTQSAAEFMNLDLVSLTSFDQISVGGNLNLNGTLNLNLDPNFAAGLGSSFDIINWIGSLNGDFSTFNNLAFNNGTETFKEVVNGNQIDLDVVAAGSATPEPSTLAMILCAALMGAGITWRLRRRRCSRIIDHVC